MNISPPNIFDMNKVRAGRLVKQAIEQCMAHANCLTKEWYEEIRFTNGISRDFALQEICQFFSVPMGSLNEIGGIETSGYLGKSANIIVMDEVGVLEAELKKLKRAICIYVREEISSDILDLSNTDTPDKLAIEWFIEEFSEENY